MIRRRTALQVVMGALSAGRWARPAAAQPTFGAAHTDAVLALAAAVLPTEIGADGQRRAVDAFMRWVADYRPGAEMDHGYGHTRPRVTPGAPAQKYAAQLADLDARAGGAFASRPLGDRQRLVTEAIAATGVTSMPGRPNGGHIATDLMASFFRSPAANDLAYGRAIGRGACRDLEGSDAKPATLTSGRA